MRFGLPFSLVWWSFIFPVGTMVTGASELAIHTGADAVSGLAVGLFALLVLLWVVTLANTVARTATGELLKPRQEAASRNGDGRELSLHSDAGSRRP